MARTPTKKNQTAGLVDTGNSMTAMGGNAVLKRHAAAVGVKFEETDSLTKEEIEDSGFFPNLLALIDEYMPSNKTDSPVFAFVLSLFQLLILGFCKWLGIDARRPVKEQPLTIEQVQELQQQSAEALTNDN